MTAGLDGCALGVTIAGRIILSVLNEKKRRGRTDTGLERTLPYDAGFSDVVHTSRNSINVWDANTDVQIVLSFLSLYFDLTLQ